MESNDMKTLTEQLMLKLMGEALDLGRISAMSDRNFKQFERTLRASCRKLIEDGHKLIDQGTAKQNA